MVSPVAIEYVYQPIIIGVMGLISVTGCIIDYINFCVECTVPSERIWCFSNNNSG